MTIKWKAMKKSTDKIYVIWVILNNIDTLPQVTKFFQQSKFLWLGD